MTCTTDILVTGAGPVGLMMAAELRRHGVGCRIIDKLRAPMNWVKALGVSQRTLEIWDHLGIVSEALDAGMNLERLRVYVNRQQVHDSNRAFPDEAPFTYPLSLPQPESERILGAHLARFGTQVERGVELKSFTQSDDGVQTVLAKADGGEETIHCRYLVGCDGAHSTVRHGLGLPFEGGRFPTDFVLADVVLDWEFEHSSSCLFMETRDETLDNLLVCIPYRDRSAARQCRYRLSTMAKPVSEVDWEAAAPEDQPPAPTLDDVRRIVCQFVPVAAAVSDLRWSSVFRISHRIVPQYQIGRVFLAGDAAHIHPPTGGQGMNTGLQDAFNLGWKLALAVKGQAQPDLLDSYNAERLPVGQAVVAGTKERTLDIANRPFQSEATLRADSQLYVNYRGSPWVAEKLSKPQAFSGGPEPGDRAPDVLDLRRSYGKVSVQLWQSSSLADENLPRRLFDLFRGTHHTLILYATAFTNEETHCRFQALAETLHRRRNGLVKVYLIADPKAAGRAEEFPVFVDAARHFQRVYAAMETSAYLVRPDGYIGFRTDAVDEAGLNSYFGKIFCG